MDFKSTPFWRGETAASLCVLNQKWETDAQEVRSQGQSLLIGFECVSYAHRLSVRVRHSYHILQSYASGLDGEGKRWCDTAKKKKSFASVPASMD